ncbi:MAG: KEOPS complex subunit Pcc1 [Nitrososphaerota archaeon]|nr:KEOPS complex subunit Pcc1 [Candidatus Calditenuis fumarioli]
MHPCALRVRIRSGSSDAIYRALLPESGVLPGQRSRVQVSLDGDELVLDFEADDTVAMRAAVNAFLRWVSAIERVLERASA